MYTSTICMWYLLYWKDRCLTLHFSIFFWVCFLVQWIVASSKCSSFAFVFLSIAYLPALAPFSLMLQKTWSSDDSVLSIHRGCRGMASAVLNLSISWRYEFSFQLHTRGYKPACCGCDSPFTLSFQQCGMISRSYLQSMSIFNACG